MFPEAEEALDSLFYDVVMEPREKLRTYGMIDYGDLMCSHSASPGAIWQLYKDEPDVERRMRYCARSYNNEANDQVYALWNFFLHSGKRDHFLAAEAYGRHMSDVDIIHIQRDGSPGGIMHYHHCHHWAAGGSPSHTCLAGLMIQYYLTGDRRIFDVCREVADWALARQEPAGIYSNRDAALVREFTTPVANLLEFYQATWEKRYGELARRSLKWLLLAQPEPGAFPGSIYTRGDRGDEAWVEQTGWHTRQAGGMTPQMLYDAVRCFPDDPIYRQALLGLAYRYLWAKDPATFSQLRIGPEGVVRLDPLFNVSLMAYAYELTEDPLLGAYCRYYVNEHFPTKAQDKVPESSAGPGLFTMVCYGSLIPPCMEATRRAAAKYGPRLDEAEQQWIEQITAAGSAPIPEPGSGQRVEPRSLGRITGYD